MIRSSIKKFFQLEASTGILLLIATFCAMMIANSDDSKLYNTFLSINLPLEIESIAYYKHLNLREWINDGLMAVFFFLVGLELKKEVLQGELSSKSKISLPAIAAIGGVVMPALIFTYFNYGYQRYISGFAVPTATDIAFAYGMLCLFGKQISNSAKVFLVALAVLDDLAAILIIAFFYSKNISAPFLLITSFGFIGLILLNYFHVKKLLPYVVCGIFIWMAILKSGVHATIAGVLMAMFIPLKVGNKVILEDIAHKLSPIVNFFILPIFAFANAGVKIDNFSLDDIFQQKIIIGIIAGLFIGKQLGVMLFSFLAVKFKAASLPRGTSWLEFYGVSIFTGIGFTMSLFIGSLAFINDMPTYSKVKIGVLIGSSLSMVYGFLVIILAGYLQRRNNNKINSEFRPIT